MVDVKPSEIKEFQKLYLNRFGIALDDDTAKLKLGVLLNQTLLLARFIGDEHKTAMDAFDRGRNVNANEDENNGRQKTE